jgi:Fe-S-cluster formation regulator IscX/YfhJ
MITKEWQQQIEVDLTHASSEEDPRQMSDTRLVEYVQNLDAFLSRKCADESDDFNSTTVMQLVDNIRHTQTIANRLREAHLAMAERIDPASVTRFLSQRLAHRHDISD